MKFKSEQQIRNLAKKYDLTYDPLINGKEILGANIALQSGKLCVRIELLKDKSVPIISFLFDKFAFIRNTFLAPLIFKSFGNRSLYIPCIEFAKLRGLPFYTVEMYISEVLDVINNFTNSDSIFRILIPGAPTTMDVKIFKANLYNNFARDLSIVYENLKKCKLLSKLVAVSNSKLGTNLSEDQLKSVLLNDIMQAFVEQFKARLYEEV